MNLKEYEKLKGIKFIRLEEEYIQEQEGKKPFDYDIYECPEELKGQLKLGDFFG